MCLKCFSCSIAMFFFGDLNSSYSLMFQVSPQKKSAKKRLETMDDPFATQKNIP